MFSFKKDKQYTLMHCEKVPNVRNRNYREQISPVERILIIVSILKILPNSHLKMKKLFLYTPTIFLHTHHNQCIYVFLKKYISSISIMPSFLHSRCGINKGLIERGSTIDH
jgi:hypothetical protein